MVDGCKVREIKMNGCFVFVVGLVILRRCLKLVAGRELNMKVLCSRLPHPPPCRIVGEGRGKLPPPIPGSSPLSLPQTYPLPIPHAVPLVLLSSDIN